MTEKIEEMNKKIKNLESQKTSFLGNSKSYKKKAIHETLMLWFNLRTQRMNLYDEFQLAKTVMQGIPCQFLKYQKINYPDGTQTILHSLNITLPNTRKSVWHRICKIDDYKHRLLVDY